MALFDSSMRTLNKDNKVFNHCPRCTSKELTFINQRFFSCADCDFTYFHNIASAVGGFIEYQGKILLTTRANEPSAGLFDLPGGFIELDETLEEGLMREVKEELNLVIHDWQYLCSYPNTYLFKEIEYHTLDSFFITKLNYSPNLLLEQLEIKAAHWLNLNEINLTKIAFPSIKNAIYAYLTRGRG